MQRKVIPTMKIDKLKFPWNAESVWVASLNMHNVTSVLLFLPQAIHFYSAEEIFPTLSSALPASEAFSNSPNLCYIEGKQSEAAER